MRYEDFVEKIKGAKKVQKQTGTMATELNLYGGKNNPVKTITREYTCPTCKHCNKEKVYVQLKRPQPLTIFQVAMLFMVYYQNKLPADYAYYHRCEAGRKFIDNILEIKVI